ncbi:MAG: DUF192 domain-containing protein [Verrucomicrobiales bacterium]|nr:DUF192 domain-containing protein [Verrucomicrobiales bacterium]
MNTRLRCSLARILPILLITVTSGCSEPSSPAPTKPKPTTTSPATPAPQTLNGPLNHAQPKLPTVKLWLGPIELETEVASRPVEIMTGMMFREKMEDTEGMIFVLPGTPRKASFYMKNTKVPLSCAYIDMSGRILEIHDLKPFDETPVESTADAISFVLEVPQGWFTRHKIEVGTLIRSDRGSLRETFYGK